MAAIHPSETPDPAAEAGVVMVIDDEQAIRALTARALRSMSVVSFESGVEALAAIEAGTRPDVILCDLMMPDFDGRDVYRAVAQRWPDLAQRILFLTGGAFVDELSDWIDSLPNAVMEKPFAIQELRRVVAERVSGVA